METKTKRIIATFAFLLIICLSFVVFHETTHYSLFKYYGCNNISYGHDFPVFYVEATCLVNTDNADLKYLNGITDIVGYTIQFFIVVFAILYLESKIKEWDKLEE